MLKFSTGTQTATSVLLKQKIENEPFWNTIESTSIKEGKDMVFHPVKTPSKIWCNSKHS